MLCLFSRGSVCESHDLIHRQLQLLGLQRHWVERWVGWEEVTKVNPRKQVTQTLHVRNYINDLFFLPYSLHRPEPLQIVFLFLVLVSQSGFCKTFFFHRMNLESRKSPKLSRANQEGQRSPRLPTKKPPVRSPSLTRREFSMDGLTEVWIIYSFIYNVSYMLSKQN